jgi:hypothetical protein
MPKKSGGHVHEPGTLHPTRVVRSAQGKGENGVSRGETFGVDHCGDNRALPLTFLERRTIVAQEWQKSAKERKKKVKGEKKKRLCRPVNRPVANKQTMQDSSHHNAMRFLFFSAVATITFCMSHVSSASSHDRARGARQLPEASQGVSRECALQRKDRGRMPSRRVLAGLEDPSEEEANALQVRSDKLRKLYGPTFYIAPELCSCCFLSMPPCSRVLRAPTILAERLFRCVLNFCSSDTVAVQSGNRVRPIFSRAIAALHSVCT